MISQAIGYWAGSPAYNSSRKLIYLDNWIDPKILVDPNFYVGIHADVVKYLQSGIKIISTLGYSFCRFQDGPESREMGNSDLSDGAWVWPEGLWIYVDKYKVRLPDEFISHMKENAFQISPNLDRHVILQGGYEFTFWDQWCLNERKRYDSQNEAGTTVH
jgi:hypothetical protein